MYETFLTATDGVKDDACLPGGVMLPPIRMWRPVPSAIPSTGQAFQIDIPLASDWRRGSRAWTIGALTSVCNERNKATVLESIPHEDDIGIPSCSTDVEGRPRLPLLVPLEVFERTYSELKIKAEGTKQRVDRAGCVEKGDPTAAKPDSPMTHQKIMYPKFRNRVARLVRPTSTELVLLDQKLAEYKRDRQYKKETVEALAKRQVVAARILGTVDKFKHLSEMRLANNKARVSHVALITQRKSRIDEDVLRDLRMKTDKKAEAQVKACEKRLAGMLPEVRLAVSSMQRKQSRVGSEFLRGVHTSFSTKIDVEAQSDASADDHATSVMVEHHGLQGASDDDIWQKLRTKTDKFLRYREAVIDRKARSEFQKSHK